jgi:hypothetical protein
MIEARMVKVAATTSNFTCLCRRGALQAFEVALTVATDHLSGHFVLNLPLPCDSPNMPSGRHDCLTQVRICSLSALSVHRHCGSIEQAEFDFASSKHASYGGISTLVDLKGHAAWGTNGTVRDTWDLQGLFAPYRAGKE